MSVFKSLFYSIIISQIVWNIFKLDFNLFFFIIMKERLEVAYLKSLLFFKMYYVIVLIFVCNMDGREHNIIDIKV